MGQYLNEPLKFLIEVVCDFYVAVVLLRFLLRLFAADFYNPISQIIARATNPPLGLLRRVLPAVGRADLACIALMLAVKYLSLFAVSMFGGGFAPAAMLVVAVAQILQLAFNMFIFAILILAVLSWIAPPGGIHHHPAPQLLEQLTRPILSPARRVIPPMGGIDISPMATVIGLYFLNKLFIPPLYDLARSLV